MPNANFPYKDYFNGRLPHTIIGIPPGVNLRENVGSMAGKDLKALLDAIRSGNVSFQNKQSLIE